MMSDTENPEPQNPSPESTHDQDPMGSQSSRPTPTTNPNLPLTSISTPSAPATANEPSPPTSQPQSQLQPAPSRFNLKRSDSLGNRSGSNSNTMPRSFEDYARRTVDLDEYAKRAGQVNLEFKREERGLLQQQSMGMEGVERSAAGAAEEESGGMLVDAVENGSGNGLGIGPGMANGSGLLRTGKAVSNGAEWRSKRAEEEYARAYDMIADRDFNMDDLGDPFLEPGAIERFRALCGPK